MTIDAHEDIELLKNARFRRLLEARVLGQTAHNAMLYALLILVVKDTGSSIKSTLLVVAYTLPAALVSIPAGTIADVVPRRVILTLGYLLRGCVVAALVYYRSDLIYLYMLAAASSVIGQFSGPAEAAVVPQLVGRRQLSAANSLMVLSAVLAQIAGAVVLAPFLIKLVDPAAVFIVCTGLFLGATYVIGWMASGFGSGEAPKPASMDFVEATREGFRILRTNRHAYLSLVYLTVSVALSRVLIILLPKYTESVLRIKAEDTVFVVAPAAIGAAFGLLLAPALTRFAGAWRVVAVGFFVFALGMIGLGLVVYVRDFIQDNLDLGISFVEKEVGVSSVITVTMLLAIPIGFAFTLVNVASRVVVNEQAPPEAQGRVFAVQSAVGDILSLVPLFIVGVMADLVGVRATLLAAAVASAAGAGYLTFSRRFAPPDATAIAPPEPAPEPELPAGSGS